MQTGRNICHGSDSVESANREIAHWFKQEEINDYNNDQINKYAPYNCLYDLITILKLFILLGKIGVCRHEGNLNFCRWVYE